MTGFQFNRRAARKIKSTAKKADRQNSLTPRGRTTPRAVPDRRYWGSLTSELEAPDDGQSSPTTATVQVWRVVPGSADDPIEMEDDAAIEEITVVNRDPSLTAPEGAVCKIEFMNGEWSFYWVGCGEG